MNKATISIIHDKDNLYDISLKGSMDDILKCLAAATAQAIVGAPEYVQQELRARFLGYLNQATVEYYRKDI